MRARGRSKDVKSAWCMYALAKPYNQTYGHIGKTVPCCGAPHHALLEGAVSELHTVANLTLRY